jgi:hypothetical protein
MRIRCGEAGQLFDANATRRILAGQSLSIYSLSYLVKETFYALEEFAF